MAPFDLDRFLTAQEGVIAAALAELTAGRKRSHWMWFVFPQIAGLGHSPTARFYAVASLAEARAYLAHPVLGQRLAACTQAALAHAAPVHDAPARPGASGGGPTRAGTDLATLFGSPDDMKFRSCMTLFERAADAPGLFTRAIRDLCDNRRDTLTERLLASADMAPHPKPPT